jgi:hypothetical protein
VVAVRGQVAEYIVVFAVVVATAIVIIANSAITFPHAVYDGSAVLAAQTVGFSYELNTFEDGALSSFYTSYDDSKKEVNVSVGVVGWPVGDIRDAIYHEYNKFGYKVKWT